LVLVKNPAPLGAVTSPVFAYAEPHYKTDVKKPLGVVIGQFLYNIIIEISEKIFSQMFVLSLSKVSPDLPW
jgi:hypothetical protein